MKRYEFINALRSELIDVSAQERENALQYYRDYFDEAGIENESEIMSNLSSPSVIAAEIRKTISDAVVTEKSAAASSAGVAYTNVNEGSGNKQSSGNPPPKSDNFFTRDVKILGSKLPMWLLLVVIIMLLPVLTGAAGGVFGLIAGAAGAAIGFLVGSVALIIAGLVMIGNGIYVSFSETLASGMVISGIGMAITGIGVMMFMLSLQIFTVWIPQGVRWFIKVIKGSVPAKAANEGGAA